MSKTALKRTIAEAQNYLCPISGEVIDPINAPELLDTDRLTERFRGGTYDIANTRVLTPRAHMERHGNLRERDEWLEELKAMVDSRQQMMKLTNKINNQILAWKRMTDEPNEADMAFLADQKVPIKKRTEQIERAIKKHLRASDDPLIKAALGVHGIGETTLSGLTVYVDLEKANSASALWSYAGLHRASHERYEKGVAGGGNKTLRTIMFNAAVFVEKSKKSPYREIYVRTKERLAASERLVKTRNNQGRMVEVAWKDTMPSHRRGAAYRAVMKHILADYWFVGRELRGLPTRPLYVEERLGHTGIIAPRDRGWVW